MDRKNLVQRENGTWTIRYKRDGHIITKGTGTSNLREARKIRDEFLRPFAASERKTVLKSIAQEIMQIDDQQQAHDDSMPHDSLVVAWRTFETAPNRPKCGAGTLGTYRGQYDALMAWMRENHPDITEVRHITPVMANDFYMHLAGKGAAPRTLVKYLNCFSLVWRILASQDRTGVAGNIWSKDHIARPALDRVTGRKRDLTASEIERLISCATDTDTHDLLILLAYTGMRTGDAVNLSWDTIRENSISFYPRKTSHLPHPKRVTIPILPAVREMLNSRMHFPDERRVFPELAESYQRDDASIAKRIGKVFDDAGFKRHVENVGIKRRAVYGAHSLRHSFATIAADAGMPSALIRQITGHESDGMLDHYTHSDRLAEQFATNGTRTGAKARLHQMINGLSDDDAERMEEALKRASGTFLIR